MATVRPKFSAPLALLRRARQQSWLAAAACWYEDRPVSAISVHDGAVFRRAPGGGGKRHGEAHWVRAVA